MQVICSRVRVCVLAITGICQLLRVFRRKWFYNYLEVNLILPYSVLKFCPSFLQANLRSVSCCLIWKDCRIAQFVLHPPIISPPFNQRSFYI